MSIMIESDVARARSRMNLSHWSEYSIEDQVGFLTSLGAAVRTREMPPSRYTMLHPQAKLSAEERELLYRWARGERQRLKQSVARPLSATD
jgi:Haem-binding domain